MSSLARASSVMAAGTAVSRVLGLVKAAALAAVVGLALTSGDAFALASSVPNSIYVIVASGVLNAILVPQVVRAVDRDRTGRQGADYVDRLVTVAVLVLGGVTLTAVLAAPAIISLYGGALVGTPLTGAQRTLAVAFAYWCLPQIFFCALYILLGQILNARGSFGPYTWAPVVNNVVALAGSATTGVALQALVLLVPLRRLGIRIRPRFGLRGMGLRSAGRAAGWTLGGVLLGQVGFFVVTTIASGISAQKPEGGTGMRILTCYSDAATRVRFSSFGRVLLEERTPSAIGNPAAIITGRDHAVSSAAARLLEHVGWTGHASFDVKVDPRDGRHVFFELNPRLGRSNHCASAAGQNPVELYVREHLQGLDPLPPGAPSETDRERLCSILPSALLLHHVADPALRARVRARVRAGRTDDPLRYGPEHDPRRLAYLVAARLDQARKLHAHHPVRRAPAAGLLAGSPSVPVSA